MSVSRDTLCFIAPSHRWNVLENSLTMRQDASTGYQAPGQKRREGEDLSDWLGERNLTIQGPPRPCARALSAARHRFSSAHQA